MPDKRMVIEKIEYDEYDDQYVPISELPMEFPVVLRYHNKYGEYVFMSDLSEMESAIRDGVRWGQELLGIINQKRGK